MFLTGLSAQNSISAELTAPKTVFQFNQGSISPELNFSQAESGDLYLAFQLNGEGTYYFLTANGSISDQAFVYAELDNYVGNYPLPSFGTANIGNGRYQFYMLMVNSGASVYDTSNWIGGLSALQKINFSLGGAEISDLDTDGDGWFDDDLNKDGFHDSDSNFDGYYDDDANRDGYHDTDSTLTTTTATNTSTDTTTNNTGSTTTTTSTSSASNTDTQTNISRGLSTYTSYCAACHGSNPLRNRDGILSARTASNTARAIERNEGGMGFLSTLSDTDLQDIADYINSL